MASSFQLSTRCHVALPMASSFQLSTRHHVALPMASSFQLSTRHHVALPMASSFQLSTRHHVALPMASSFQLSTRRNVALPHSTKYLLSLVVSQLSFVCHGTHTYQRVQIGLPSSIHIVNTPPYSTTDFISSNPHCIISMHTLVKSHHHFSCDYRNIRRTVEVWLDKYKTYYYEKNVYSKDIPFGE